MRHLQQCALAWMRRSEALILRGRGQLPEHWSRRFIRIHAVQRVIWNRWKNANTNSKNLQLSPENLKTSGTPLTQSVLQKYGLKMRNRFLKQDFFRHMAKFWFNYPGIHILLLLSITASDGFSFLLRIQLVWSIKAIMLS